jgi:hypothetical protein
VDLQGLRDDVPFGSPPNLTTPSLATLAIVSAAVACGRLDSSEHWSYGAMFRACSPNGAPKTASFRIAAAMVGRDAAGEGENDRRRIVPDRWNRPISGR